MWWGFFDSSEWCCYRDQLPPPPLISPLLGPGSLRKYTGILSHLNPERNLSTVVRHSGEERIKGEGASNCKTASHIRERWRAHGNGVSVHMHPVIALR